MSNNDVHGLPALPDTCKTYPDGPRAFQWVYTAGQMRDYARAAVEAALRQSGEAVLARGWFHRLPDGDYDFHDEASGAGKDCDGCIPCVIATAPPSTSGLVEALREALASVLDGLGAMTTPHELCGYGFNADEAARIVALATHDTGGG